MYVLRLADVLLNILLEDVQTFGPREIALLRPQFGF